MVNIVSKFCFLETDIREQKKKYQKGIQISVYSTVNDLHDEIKFENLVLKDKNNFILK